MIPSHERTDPAPADASPAADAPEVTARAPRTLLLACGALAQELRAVLAGDAWRHITLHCLPAELHNRPERIVPRLDAKLAEIGGDFERVLIGYADCGTGGALAAYCTARGLTMLPGAHCYAFFAGLEVFERLADAEPGTFYLTDFLARHFDTLVWRGLGLDRHPELAAMYFAHYRRLVYLQQTPTPELETRARDAAERLGLAYHPHPTGLGPLAGALHTMESAAWRN